MRLYALIFACFVLQAQSASFRSSRNQGLDDLDNIEFDNTVTDPESVVKQNAHNEIKSGDALIPVAVVEEKPLKKIDENSNDYVPDVNESHLIKNVDLKNPGPPQRQEHETQNPESFADKEKALITVNEKIEETTVLFSEKLKEVSNNFENLIKSNKNIPLIQQNIKNLKDSFYQQFSDLNNTVLSYINTDNINVKSGLKTVNRIDKNVVESKLKDVKNKFDSGVGMLSEGVELLSIMREEDEEIKAKEEESPSYPNESTSTAAPTGIYQGGPVQSFFTNLMNSVTNSMQSLQTSISNPSQNNTITNLFLNNPLSTFIQSSVANAQNPFQSSQGQDNVDSDDPTPQRPTILQNIQNTIQNFFNPNLNPNNLKRPSTVSSNATASTQAANSVPSIQTFVAPPGPIRQIIRGIQQSVQRVPVPNTTKPTEKPKGDLKGHYGGHDNQGDNNDVNRVNDDADQTDDIKTETAQEAEDDKKIGEVPKQTE